MSFKLADRLSHVEEYYFSRKLEEIRQMRISGIDVINLGIGSPDLLPPPGAIQATQAALAGEKNHGYAPYRSTPELRAAMASWYERTYGVRVDAQTELLPLLGSKEGIFYLSLALLNPGDQVLVPDPGYPAYASVASLIGAEPIFYPLTEKKGWLPDLEALQKMGLSRCRLMWVNYPHMPTGASCPEGFFGELARFARDQNIIVANDNPYGLILNQRPPQSILSADTGLERVVELNSMSKSFSMAGWRVGMILAHRQIIDAVLQVKSNVDSGMFHPIQSGAIAALETGPAFHEERNRVYTERRALVWRLFDKLGYRYDREQVGLFVWARAPESVADVAQHLERVLKERHVFLTPGMIFGSQGLRYARASLCAPASVLTEALRRLEAPLP